MRRSYYAVVMCIMGLLLFTFGVGAQEEPIKIGMNQAMTGQFAAAGIDATRGAQMAVDEINRAGGVLGRPLELVVEDNRGEVEAGIAAAERLVQVHKVPVVVGPNYSFIIAATHDIYWEAGIPNLMYGTMPNLTKLGNPYLFRTRPNDTLTALAAVTYAVEKLGAQRIVIIYQAEEWGMGGRDALTKALNELYGMDPVATIGAHLDVRDYTGIWAEAAKYGPDLVFQWLHGGLHAGLSLRARYELGLSHIPVLGSVAINEPGTVEVAGVEATEGVMVVGDYFRDELKVRLVNGWYYERYGEDILGINSLTTYDTIHLVARAIEKAGVVEPNAIRDALIGLEMEGVVTTYYVREEDHESVFAVKVGVMRDGTGRWLDTVELPRDVKF